MRGIVLFIIVTGTTGLSAQTIQDVNVSALAGKTASEEFHTSGEKGERGNTIQVPEEDNDPSHFDRRGDNIWTPNSLSSRPFGGAYYRDSSKPPRYLQILSSGGIFPVEVGDRDRRSLLSHWKTLRATPWPVVEALRIYAYLLADSGFSERQPATTDRLEQVRKEIETVVSSTRKPNQMSEILEAFLQRTQSLPNLTSIERGQLVQTAEKLLIGNKRILAGHPRSIEEEPEMIFSDLRRMLTQFYVGHHGPSTAATEAMSVINDLVRPLSAPGVPDSELRSKDAQEKTTRFLPQIQST
jgi:hypothetical protein